MAVPRHHLAKGHQRRRRSHLALKPLVLVACEHCKKQILPHRVCKFCGYYKGREVVNVLAKELKRQEKQRARQAA
ncbi:MAG TPA: 50S ribosomal protein L32 [Candidatus Paceibacterota bacterium]|nr:50S ribosomal protein L32 [Candidatus Paceibacterota bacterium]